MLRRATALKRICDRQRVQNATSMLSPPFPLFDGSLSLIFYTPLCFISTCLSEFLNVFPTFIIGKYDIQKNP